MSGKKSTRSKNKWNAKNYDRIAVIVPKGRKNEIKAHAEKYQESLNGFINRAIAHEIERDEKQEK